MGRPGHQRGSPRPPWGSAGIPWRWRGPRWSRSRRGRDRSAARREYRRARPCMSCRRPPARRQPGAPRSSFLTPKKLVQESTILFGDAQGLVPVVLEAYLEDISCRDLLGQQLARQVEALAPLRIGQEHRPTVILESVDLHAHTSILAVSNQRSAFLADSCGAKLPMVFLVAVYLGCAVELFEEDDPGQGVRECDAAEGPDFVGSPQYFG